MKQAEAQAVYERLRASYTPTPPDKEALDTREAQWTWNIMHGLPPDSPSEAAWRMRIYRDGPTHLRGLVVKHEQTIRELDRRHANIGVGGQDVPTQGDQQEASPGARDDRSATDRPEERQRSRGRLADSF